MRQQFLEGIGLTKNEAKVYLTLLKLGSALAGEITEKSGVHRRNVYDSIERLIERGLVGYVIKKNRKYFEAVDPHRLLMIIKERKEGLKEREKEIRSILPELLLARKLSREMQTATIYRGREGIKTILEDVIKTRKTNLVLGAHVPEKLMDIITKFHEKRIKAKVVDKMLFNKIDFERGKKLTKMPFTEVRFMPRGYDSPITANIYDNKVGLIIWSEDNPMGILIVNEKVAIGFREFFNLIWKMAEK